MRVGVSQRVDKVSHYYETRDGLDHRWIHFLEQVGLQVLVIPNQIKDPASYYLDLQLEGLILTGGNDPAQLENSSNVSVVRDRTEATLLSLASGLGHPILGVCRGMQYLCLQLGEQLSRTEGHVSRRHSLICDPEFPYPNGHEVNSYHNWALKSLRECSPFKIMAQTDDNSIEAIQHKTEPTFGIMWHPEREKEFLTQDLNFFKRVFNND